MDYLCMAVQKQLAEKQNFDSRESAEAYFWERFGGALEEKLEEKKKKLEGRIRYYERRAEKHRESREIREICEIRRKAAQEELEQVNRRLNEEDGAYGDCYYEEKYDIPEQPFFGEAELILHQAGIFRIGSTYRVAEQKHYCIRLKVASEEGILDVRKRIPASMLTNSIYLEICQESPESAKDLTKKIKKIVAQEKKAFAGQSGR